MSLFLLCILNGHQIKSLIKFIEIENMYNIHKCISLKVDAVHKQVSSLWLADINVLTSMKNYMAWLKLEDWALTSAPLFARNPLKRQKIHSLIENEH